MAATVEIIIKTVDQSSKGIKEASKGLDAFKKNLKTLTVGLVAAGAAAAVTFKAFERGTAVRQTALSFDLLLTKVGASSSLMRELQEVSSGTISKMELMSSTSLLLAGAQGKLALSMADATPKLLEIAKAANKLNPALGTTSFLYESLGRGIKRSSPLILDNLGLVIKIGEANEKFAKSIGKTVDELSAEERQMALLNETLRAGDVLIDQVGGSVDSLTDSTAQATAGFKNLKDAILADVGGKGTIFGDIGKDLSDVALLVQEFGTGKTLNALFNPIANIPGFAGVGGTGREDLIKEFNKREKERIELQQAVEKSALDVEDNTGASDQLMAEIQALRDERNARLSELLTPEGAGMSLDAIVAERANLGIRNLAPIPVELSPFFTDLDTNIASQIQSAMSQIDFKQAGGQELVQGFDQLFADIDAGKIGAELGQQMFAQMFIQAQQIEVAIGNITADQAAKNIRDTLGVSIEEARNAVNDIENTLRRIGRMKVQARITLQINTTGDTGTFGQRPGLAAGGPVTGGKTFLVGEEGPELFTPSRSGSIVPNDELGERGGANMAGVEAGIAQLSIDFKNGFIDLGQKIVEAVG